MTPLYLASGFWTVFGPVMLIVLGGVIGWWARSWWYRRQGKQW